jgi:hypothetical protein
VTTVEPSGGAVEVRSSWRRRIAARLAFAATFIPFAVVAAMWVRGGSVGDRMVWHGDRSVVFLSTSRGGMAIGLDFGDWSRLPRPGGRLSYERGGPETFSQEMSGALALNVSSGDTLHAGRAVAVTWLRYVPKSQTYSINRASAPTWLPALFAAIPPVIWVSLRAIRHARRRRRQAYGRCTSCNYDLRSSFDICPECGTVVSAVTWRELDNEFGAPPFA